MWNKTNTLKPDTDREVLGIHRGNGKVLTNFYPRIKVWRHGLQITHWQELPGNPTDVDTSHWKHFKEHPKGGEHYCTCS